MARQEIETVQRERSLDVMVRRRFMPLLEPFAITTFARRLFASWFTHGVTNGSHLRKAIKPVDLPPDRRVHRLATGVGTYTQPTEEDRYQMIHTCFATLFEEELPEAVGKMKQAVYEAT